MKSRHPVAKHKQAPISNGIRVRARNRLAVAALAAVSILSSASFSHAGAIGLGDLVVEEQGNGSSALTSAATAVYLNDYSVSGSTLTLQQTINFLTTASGNQDALTDSGVASSDGLLSTSSDGNYIFATGYNDPVGTASVTGSAVARVIGVVSVATGSADTSTAFSAGTSGPFYKQNIRQVASVDGGTLYAAGQQGSSGEQGGIFSITSGTTGAGTEIAASPTSTTSIHVFDGQLYAGKSNGTNALDAIGTGVPTSSSSNTSVTTGQSITNVGDFYLTPNGQDLYVIDESSTPAVYKYIWNGTAFDAVYNVVTGTALLGLTASVSGNNVTFYATTAVPGIATGGNQIVSFTDLASATTPAQAGSNNYTVLATAPTDDVFRGVTLAAPAPEPASLGLLGLGCLSLLRRQRRAAERL